MVAIQRSSNWVLLTLASIKQKSGLIADGFSQTHWLV